MPAAFWQAGGMFCSEKVFEGNPNADKWTKRLDCIESLPYNYYSV